MQFNTKIGRLRFFSSQENGRYSPGRKEKKILINKWRRAPDQAVSRHGTIWTPLVQNGTNLKFLTH